MNEKQPYEKHLAEKLQQLPPPADVNHAWEQMRVLLDKELPRGGGFGGNGRGGNGRRWIISILAGILLIGTWLARERFQPANKPGNPTATVPPNTATGHGKTPASGLPSPATDPDPQKTGETTNSQQADTEPPAGDAVLQPVTGDPGTAPHVPGTGGQKTNATGFADKPGEKTMIDPVKRKHEAIITHNNVNQYTNSSTNKNSGKNRAGNNKIPVHNKNADKQLPVNNDVADSDPESTPVQGDAMDLSIQSDALLPGASMNKNYAAREPLLRNHSANAGNTAAAPKPKAKKTREDRTFAIGLSLPMTFPVADQKAMGYNFNAGPNTVSDYLPSPHLQYHINSKTYLQTEIQFLSPQYIRPLLLFQQQRWDPVGNATIYNSIYAKKLYYFNVPVTIHHSPLPNFYLGSGIQFSSLLSGVALYEDRKVYGSQEVLINERYDKFSRNALAQRMNGTEMRLLLDMNYYWERFTVGLRYNQAFNNYVSFRLTNTSGYTYDKNKALLFYLRFNIWEDKKRKNTSRSMLSLK